MWENPTSIQDHLEKKGLILQQSEKPVKNSIFYADAMSRWMSISQHEQIAEKIIPILADAEDAIWKTSEDIIYERARKQIDALMLTVRVGISNPETIRFRSQLLEVAHLDPDPKKNNMIWQVLLAVIDEFVITLWDLWVDIYKSVDKNGMESLLKEIKDTIFSWETWKWIIQEMGSWLTSLITDWSGGEDMVYRKIRQSVIALGLAMIVKKIATKFAKKALKTSVKAWIQATPLPNH